MFALYRFAELKIKICYFTKQRKNNIQDGCFLPFNFPELTEINVIRLVRDTYHHKTSYAHVLILNKKLINFFIRLSIQIRFALQSTLFSCLKIENIFFFCR